ncbi:PocR ligand-binding domain-containing protein [Desnuesiella massiliensis]|uniref:PocR ligand-binding domain-containing protein n=1 Tax=Desnuesiella massiliensis TaxID=1650662 RepID=UPI0006E1E000|nr:PocR ligand-binding domain-containing protein [Desnuesiella massiliensis]
MGEYCEYNLSEIVDLNHFQRLMKEFYRITKIPHALISVDGTMLSYEGWHDICTKFYRKSEKGMERCLESLDILVKKTKELNSGEYDIRICKNGLVEAYAPIKIDGYHIATLIFGQFFIEAPDLDAFKKEAKVLQLDCKEYYETLNSVPIISEKQLDSYMKFYIELSHMLSQIGLNNLLQKQNKKELMLINKELDDMVNIRTKELRTINYRLKSEIKSIKAMEKKLKDSEERYRSLIELLPYGVLVIREGNVIFANSKGLKYFNMVSVEQIKKYKYTDLFCPHEDYMKIYLENLELLERNHKLDQTEEKLVNKITGETMYFETSIVKIAYEGEEAILVVFKDISDKKSLEVINKKVIEYNRILNESLEYERLRTEFFANISHEFKTPINVISSALQISELILKNKTDIDEVGNSLNKYINMMKKNCFRLIRLVNNLIDITSIDLGHLKLNLENADLIQVIEDTIEKVSSYADKKNIDIVFDTDIEVKYMSFDKEKIKRVLLNLFSNSIKFTETFGTIYVSIYDKTSKIYISIKDTGIGIPVEKQKYIFDRFVQVDKSLSRNHEGSGIGLSLVKSLIEMHDGNIELNSSYKKGTEFIIELPVKVIDENHAVKLDIENKNIDIETVKIEFADIYL